MRVFLTHIYTLQ